jgi:hypothetical protein
MALGLIRKKGTLRFSAMGRVAAASMLVLAMSACGKDGDGEGATRTEDLQGRWGTFRRAEPAENLSPEQQAAINELEKLGYVDGIKPPPDAEGVTVYSKELARPGLNLFISSHRPQANLMDMEGKILHQWTRDFVDAFPDYPHANKDNDNQLYFRRVFLRPGGDLLVIFEGMGVMKLDRDSNVLWSAPNKAHHDLDFDDEGRVYVLTREGQFHPRFGIDRPVLLDYVTILSPGGERLRRISLDQAYLDSEFPPPMEVVRQSDDIYHTNTLTVLDGSLADRIPAFAKGNLLLSFRNLSRLAVLDPEAEKLVWVAEGPWKDQHEPSVLDNGNMLVFDNRGGQEINGGSRALEFNPRTLEPVWAYEGSPQSPLFTGSIGTTSRLVNGNTLIVESMNGRVIEVSPQKRIVWEFINPNRAGDDRQFIAVIPELTRIDPAGVADWLELPSTGGRDEE